MLITNPSVKFEMINEKSESFDFSSQCNQSFADISLLKNNFNDFFDFMTLELNKSTNTAMVANPIPRPLMAEDVVPKVGHIPKRSTNVGFSLTIPFIKILKLFIVCSPFFIC